MSISIDIYNEKAEQFVEQYDSVHFESVHKSWIDFWPNVGESVLDIGAGSGRDARWFIKQGCSVVAVEPCDNLRQIGSQNSSQEIQWFGDYLPNLVGVKALERQFDLILLSAVWMHIPIENRLASLSELASLLSEQGKIVITLRHGSFEDGRESHTVSINELRTFAAQLGLSILDEFDDSDALNRNSIYWQTVVLGW
ncbi:MAG: class I SAM-dependent methyltransferase [Vibrio sp.]